MRSAGESQQHRGQQDKQCGRRLHTGQQFEEDGRHGRWSGWLSPGQRGENDSSREANQRDREPTEQNENRENKAGSKSIITNAQKISILLYNRNLIIGIILRKGEREERDRKEREDKKKLLREQKETEKEEEKRKMKEAELRFDEFYLFHCLLIEFYFKIIFLIAEAIQR